MISAVFFPDNNTNVYVVADDDGEKSDIISARSYRYKRTLPELFC